MDYKLIHDSIITRAQNRATPDIFEKHHIIPKSHGGTNNKTNVVKLTPKEHYVIHRLLTRIYPEDVRLVYAFWMMSNGSRSRRPNPSPRAYLEARTAFIEAMSKRRSPRKGVSLSAASKQKISISKKGQQPWLGRTHKTESIQKMSVSAQNRRIRAEMELKRRQSISQKLTGSEKSEQARQNIRAAKLGDKNPMFGKTGAHHPNSRKVTQETLEGVKVKVWDSLSDIERCFNLKRGRMYAVLNTKNKTVAGFKWSYE